MVLYINGKRANIKFATLFNKKKMVKEVKIRNIEEKSEIRFAISGYDDLFSDFDARPVSERGLSEDFLSEAKRAGAVKEGEKLDFIFLISKNKRDLKKEVTIKDRLERHFKKHFGLSKNEKSKAIKQGVFFTILGVVLMLLATFLFFKFKNESLLASFFTILLEPASWFLFWEGLDHAIFESRNINSNLFFYKKMSSANIKFVSV